MNGEEIEKVRDSLDGLNITELIKKRIEEEIKEEKDE